MAHFLPRSGWAKALVIALISLVGLLIIVRVSLPFFLVDFANKKVDEVPGYDGYVGDIDLALWRGAASMQEFHMVKVGADSIEPFVEIKNVEVGIDWKALFNGKVVVVAGISEPKVNFVKAQTPEKSQTDADLGPAWQAQLKEMLPVTVDHFWVQNGTVRFRDVTTSPQVNIYASAINIDAKNFSNRKSQTGEILPASLKVDAKTLGNGTFNLDLELQPLKEPPDFDLTLSLRDAQLKELNNFFQAYGKFDFEKGTMSVFSELAALNGRIEGYVKPLLEDVVVLNFTKDRREQGFWLAVWEGIVGGTKEVLENPRFERLGTQVPISGTFEGPDVSIWTTVVNLFRNGFIEALSKQLNDSINIQDVTSSRQENAE